MSKVATPAAFQLRDFRPSDFLLLWQIDQDCFPSGIAYSQEELAFYMTRRGAFTIVAESREPEPVGFIVAHRVRRRDGSRAGHIITIDVLPKARRAALGSHLLAVAEQRLQEAGCAVLTLEVAVDNAPAISFYQRHGYAILRTLPRYYNGELDALRMEKSLGPSDVKQ